MPAYLLLLLAIASRLIPHSGFYGFTAMGGALLFFGARRSWREMLLPMLALMGTDYVLTVYTYHYSFVWQSYLVTWGWYAMAMVLGGILLKAKFSKLRLVSGIILGPTTFFLVSNFSVWVGSRMYTPDMSGLMNCYIAGLPFYRNDLLSTTLVAGLAFGVSEAVNHWNQTQLAAIKAGK